MDFDIISKLFPNVLTMITQLVATGVIYIMYRKYLKAPVIAYLDKRNALVKDELDSAKKLNDEAVQLKAKSDLEYAALNEELSAMKERIIRDANLEKEKIIASAQVEIDLMKKQNARALESDRKLMYEEVNTHLLDIASSINERVLENVSFNETDMLKALQKEIDSNDYQH